LGVNQGTRVSGAFAVLKIVALLGFSAAGLVWIAAGNPVAAPVATADMLDGWLGVVLLLMFAYGGFEAALTARRIAEPAT
jgi:amino acid transporter